MAPSPSGSLTHHEPNSGRSSFLSSPIFALVVLFSMNLLNYIDRYVFFSAGPTIQHALGFSNLQFGILSISFMVVYTVVSPVVGWMGDRFHRRRILAFGVGLWSIATVGTAFAQGFYDMFFWRALLGIGEASYGVIAPALLADLFPIKRRGRVMGLYYLALPLGGAIGYLVGGWFAMHNWRHAFWVVGLPGLAAAVAGLIMHDPGRGASEAKVAEPIAEPTDRDGDRGRSKVTRPSRLPDFLRHHPSDAKWGGGAKRKPSLRDYLQILKTPSFLFNTAGQAAVTFAIGAYAVWGSAFYQTVRGMGADQAGKTIGAITAGAGLLGIIMGTLISDRLGKVTRRAYLIWPGLAVLLAAPCATLAILSPDRTISLASLFAASLLMASVLGPSNTVTANVVAASQRAAGYAVSIFLIHLLGDISSPALVGAIADHFGTPEAADGPVGRFFASIGAVPTPSATGPSNLTLGMLIVVPMLLLGWLFFWTGARWLPADQERARAQGGEASPGFVGH